jgi:hypothetical protein
MDILGTTSVSPIYGLTEVVLFLPIFLGMSRIGNFGRISYCSYFCRRAQVALLQDSPKIQSLDICRYLVDWIGLAIMILN